LDTEKIEDLLAQLIEKQDELISRIASLESTVEQQLSEVNSGISDLAHSSSQINDELNWWGEGSSLAKHIVSGISDLKQTSSQINDELNWWGEGPSLAKKILDGLSSIEAAALARD
jgi:uncharacterized phage infection (PIP) family protein YhgE